MDIQQTIAQMTLEEKASLCSGSDFWHTQPIERLGVPAVMVSDGPHGLRKQDTTGDLLGVNGSTKAVCFPTACACAASFDPAVARRIGEALGDACQHEKVSVILGPGVNIKRSPLCGRNFEYYSEDPYLAAEMTVGYIEGVQSKNIGVSVKHFAANNQEHRRMNGNSEVDERTMREIYLPAFEAGVKRAHAWTVMCSYNKINGVYASENRVYLTDILRGEWGFDGYVMSDWGAVSDRVRGLEAGLDLEMPASNGSNDRCIVQAVREGKLDEKDIDLAVERILTVNQRYLENRKPSTSWDKEAQHALARELAAECMVLLKNEDNILPLTKGESLAVIGEFGRTPRYQGGGSSHINSFKITGLLDALEGTENVTFAAGYSIKEDSINEALIAEAVQAAKNAKAAVVVVGLTDAYESEGYDRSHLRMPVCQNALIERVAEANPNTVVVLYNGSPVEMPWIGQVKAVVEAYLGGQAVGGATKDILFGDVNQSGRLPESFPHKLEDNPSYLSYGGEGNTVAYHEGVFVGYRYYDKKKMNVLFSFGYGLSYTTFAYSNLMLSAKRMSETDTLTVTLDVTNTGSCAGKEVVQLYISDLESAVFRPVRELKSIAKVALVPGETKTITFTLGKRAFAYWDVKRHDWHVESGDFKIQIGRSSREIVLEKQIYVEGGTEVFEPVTMDTIFMDALKIPRSKSILQPMMNDIIAGFGLDGEKSETTESVITSEMKEAMLDYMPLRGILSFGHTMTYEEVQVVVESLNVGMASGNNSCGNKQRK
jgi:beta-glucosidase